MNKTLLAHFRSLNPRRLLAAVMLVMLLNLSMPPQPAGAVTTRYVSPGGSNTGNDCSNPAAPCASVSHAIAQAIGGDTIDISAGTFTESGLIVDKTLTFHGAGAGSTIIQANALPNTAAARVFNINSGVTATFQALTVRHGSLDASTDGGGIYSSGTLILENVILTLNVAANGGGLFNNGGTVTITNSQIHGNKATNVSGGGLFNSNGTMTIVASTISGNNASMYGEPSVVFGAGGGIYNWGSSATLTVTDSAIVANTSYGYGAGIVTYLGSLSVSNSTVSGNTAGESGGGLNLYGPTTLTHVTITENRAAASMFGMGGGGGFVSTSTVLLQNSIVVGNRDAVSSFEDDCRGSYTSQGYNLFGNNTGCSTVGPGDQTTINPRLTSASDHGGPTPTNGLLVGSPAIDQIPPGVNGCGTTYLVDQRGMPRPQGANCDVGAFEGAILPHILYVAPGGSNSGNSCGSPATPCATLAYAIAQASNNDQINLAAGTYTEAGLVISKNLALAGAGAGVTILQAHAQPNMATSRVLTINDPAIVDIYDLTIQHGRVIDAFANGGGIFNHGTLTLGRVTVRANSAGNVGGGLSNGYNVVIEDSLFSGNSAQAGGGLYTGGGQAVIRNTTFSGNTITNESYGGALVQSVGTLLLENSTISGNSYGGIVISQGNAQVLGSTITSNVGLGGVSVYEDANVQILNSTVSGNSNAGGGAGINNSSDYLTIINSTITNNTTFTPGSSVAEGGGILNWGTVILKNSIVAGNSAEMGIDCGGYTITSQGYNLTGVNTGCAANAAGDLHSATPRLNPLGSYGGLTQTHSLKFNSPALDQIPLGVNECGTTLTVDQRGRLRPGGAACDIGAYEETNTERIYLPLILR